MSISRILVLASVLCSFAVTRSSAQIIDYNITGTFGTSVPSTLVSAPNATFDIQFSLPAEQPPNPFTNAFDVTITDESYALNGQTIFAGQSGRETLGMGLFSPTDTLDVFLPAQFNYEFLFDDLQVLFSGSVSNPTLIPASFDFNTAGVAIANGSGTTGYALPNAHVTATAAVPEPPPLALAGTATFFVCLGLFFRRRRPFGVRRSQLGVWGSEFRRSPLAAHR